MAMFSALAGGARRAKSLDKIKAAKSSKDLFREHPGAKSLSAKFDPIRSMHVKNIIPDIEVEDSFKSRSDGSLNVTKLAFGSHNRQKMGDSLENKVGKDTPHHKGEHFTENREEFNSDVAKVKDNSAKTEYTDNTKSSTDDARLDRAFGKARENFKQHSSQYGSEEEKFQARGIKIENYPYYDASRQKVVHENNHKPLNVEKSTLNHNQELKDKIAKRWDRLHSMSNHLDSFNQQLRQIDLGNDVVEALMEAYGVRSPLSEDGNTQQNTNGTSDFGDKLKEKMGLAGNKKNQPAERKTGGESLKAGGKSIGNVSHMATEHKTGMNLARREIKETGLSRSFEKAVAGVHLRKRMEMEPEEVMRVQDRGNEQPKTVGKLLATQEIFSIEHHKPDVSERNRNMEKENIVAEESANSKLHNNDIKEENESGKFESQDKKHKRGKEEEPPQEYGEIKMEGNNDKVEKYSKERSQQSLEASLLSQRSVNREAKVASDLESSASKVLDAIPDVSTTAPTVTNVPNVAAATVLYKAGDNIQRPLKSSEGLSQRSVSVEQLKEEYIGLIEGKAENEFQKSMARKSAVDAYEAFVKVGGDPKKLVEDFKEAAKSADFAAQVTSWLRQKEYTGFRDTHQVQQEASMAREIKVES